MKKRPLSARHLQRWFGHPLEAALVYALYGFFKVLPTDTASALGGWIGRTFFAKLGATKKAKRNLALAMPELSELEREAIVLGMWDNLGRVLAEYPHLDTFDESRVEVIGQDVLEQLVAEQRSALLISGHFANWEVIPVTAAKRGLDVQLIYRPANNPYVDRLLSRARTPMGKNLARKGTAGARSVHTALRNNRMVGMLVDQKYNHGRAIPFFGRPAMTAPAVALLALHHKAPIIMAHIERLNGAHFRLRLLPPMTMPPETMSQDEAVTDILTRINLQLEAWIRDVPSQWLWLHRRWPD